MKVLVARLFRGDIPARSVWALLVACVLATWLVAPALDSVFKEAQKWFRINISGEQVEGWWETPIISITPAVNSRFNADLNVLVTPWGMMRTYPVSVADVEGVLINATRVMVQYDARKAVMVANYISPARDFELICIRIHEEVRNGIDPINLHCHTGTVFFQGKYYEWTTESTRGFKNPLSTDPEFFFKR